MKGQYKVECYVGDPRYTIDYDYLCITAKNKKEALKIGKQKLHLSLFSWETPQIVEWNVERVNRRLMKGDRNVLIKLYQKLHR